MNKDAGWATGPNGERVAAVQIVGASAPTGNLPPLHELPKELEEAVRFAGDTSTRDALRADIRAYALSYGRAVQEACARVCDQVAYDWDEQRPFRRVAEDCAAAIRNGVIREGEGNATDHASDAD